MKRITKITLFALSLVLLTGLAGVVGPLGGLPAAAQAAGDTVLSFDVACDCRTGSPGFFTGTRGDPFIVNGKIFPVGTPPSGTATNDPTQAVNGVAPPRQLDMSRPDRFPFSAGCRGGV